MNAIDRFEPLANATSAVTIGDFEINNDENAVNIRGSLRLEPNQADIVHARSLAKMFERAAAALEDALAKGKSAPSTPATGTDEFGLPL